jgi:hypothetical protein
MLAETISFSYHPERSEGSLSYNTSLGYMAWPHLILRFAQDDTWRVTVRLDFPMAPGVMKELIVPLGVLKVE